MEDTREDRMRSRMRGAARHQVSDADFGTLFTIPAPAPEPEPEPATEPSTGSSDPPAPASQAPTPARPAAKRTSPNTSAKRRRLDPESRDVAASPQAQLPAQPASANRSSRRQPPQPPAGSDPYDLENAPSPTDPPPSSTPRTRTSARQSRQSGISDDPKPATQNTAPPQSSPLSALPTDEVSESPANAPGSGHRRRVRDTGARDSSAILQSALRSVDSDPADGYLQSSSPLSRLSRKSIAGNLASARSTRTGLRRSTRLSGSPDGDVNELASDPPAVPEVDTIAEEPTIGATRDDSLPEVAGTVIEEPTAADSPEVDEAREIDDREAARRLGRKRPRRSIPAPSPELASEDAAEEPVAKRPRKEAPPKKKTKSPAKQRQPKAPRPKQSKPESRRKPQGDQGTAGRPPVGIAVQRFTKVRRHSDDSDDSDVLNTMMTQSNRDGVNAIDVLAQMCEEIIGATLKTFKDAFREAQDAPTKKELRVKISALGAFQEELRTRLLEHTIAIDTLSSLKRRVREAQKEKLKLRERLVEIRAEREHVALRMDAIRAKHEKDSKEALHNISLSAAMHDVDLAIERGRAAPALPAKAAKTADLANLELLISKVTEQACSRSASTSSGGGGGIGGGGGVLGQIKGFNAFLERAMAVL